MIQQEITTIKLIATEGFILTNGESYGREVYLGTLDAPCNWYEITESQYNDIMAHEAQMEII